MMGEVTVIKQDHLGKEVFRYHGRVVEREVNMVVVEAFFRLGYVEEQGLAMQKNDRFLETYCTDRWYNVFEIHACEDDALKGWYCNVAYPPVIGDGQVSYRDLALDLIVHPDGRQIVVDEDEFDALPLSAEVRRKAREGLAELQAHFSKKSYT
jgi:hypothetical protein